MLPLNWFFILWLFVHGLVSAQNYVRIYAMIEPLIRLVQAAYVLWEMQINALAFWSIYRRFPVIRIERPTGPTSTDLSNETLHLWFDANATCIHANPCTWILTWLPLPRPWSKPACLDCHATAASGLRRAVARCPRTRWLAVRTVVSPCTWSVATWMEKQLSENCSPNMAARTSLTAVRSTAVKIMKCCASQNVTAERSSSAIELKPLFLHLAISKFEKHITALFSTYYL